MYCKSDRDREVSARWPLNTSDRQQCVAISIAAFILETDLDRNYLDIIAILASKEMRRPSPSAHSPDAESSASRSGSSPDFQSDSPPSSTSSAIHSPPSPAFAFPPKKEARSILKSYSQPRTSPSAKAPDSIIRSPTSAEPLSPDRLLPLPPTPPMTAVKVDESDESIEDYVPSPGERTRSVRFKPRVRISCGSIFHDATSVIEIDLP